MGRWSQSRRRVGATVASGGSGVPAPTESEWALQNGGDGLGYNTQIVDPESAPDGVNGYHVRYRFFGGPAWLTFAPVELGANPDFGASDWPNEIEVQIAWTTDGADVSDYSSTKATDGS
jgi:hypothetical protein